MLHQARLILALVLFTSAAAVATPKGIVLSPVSDKTYAKEVLQPRRGKAVLVQFWASYCVPCLAELPKLLAMKPAVEKKGGDIVFVNVDPPGHPEQIEKVLRQKGVTRLDSLQVTNEDPEPFIDAVDKQWMGEVPFAALYDKTGKLQKTMSGEQDPAALEQAIEAAAR